MIFNGGKNRIDGNSDFFDFFHLLQNYHDSRVREGHMTFGSGSLIGAITEQKSTLNGQNFIDTNILDRIVESLFRVLMDGLFIEK